jgi:hypothetical protein
VSTPNRAARSLSHQSPRNWIGPKEKYSRDLQQKEQLSRKEELDPQEKQGIQLKESNPYPREAGMRDRERPLQQLPLHDKGYTERLRFKNKGQD